MDNSLLIKSNIDQMTKKFGGSSKDVLEEE